MAAVLLFVLFPVCFSCAVRVTPKNRAKIVESYVLSAKFDGKTDLPQLGMEKIQSSPNRRSPFVEEGILESKDGSYFLPNHRYQEDIQGEVDEKTTLKERDLLVHHHHPLPPPPPPLPPPPPPPPPIPPAPVGLALVPSLFAVGFIAFLILLNTLQTSLLLTIKSKHSLLGSVTKPLGRRKRFVPYGNLTEQYGGY